MQSEVPALPVVCNEAKKRSARNTEVNDQSSAVQVKNHNTCKFSSKLVSNRKQLHPLVGGPYRNSMRLYTLSEPIRPTNKTTIGQRVMSAKMLRVKQLQNQLADAHYHLNELANENRLLKALQKRQDSALRKYEGANAELPRIINSHHEELKVLQTKHKKLKMQYKQVCDLLKEKDNEIHLLQTQNKHLTQLSKDRRLEEREKLQTRVSDLNYRIEQQQETIQTLNRKLALESKSLKHQLHQEMAKHKETQKHLHETLEKLKTLEDFLDNREKRLYSSGRLPACNKGKPVSSQSLMNLGQNNVPSHPLKSGGKTRLLNNSENGSLPKLTRAESGDGKTIPNVKDDRTEEITETMSSLQQVRKFRLQKSYSRNGSASLLNLTDKSEEDDSARNESYHVEKYSSIEKLKIKRATMNGIDSDEEEIKKIVNDFEITKTPFKLSKRLMREYGYSSSENSDSETEVRDEKETENLAKKSRDLHTRLTAEESSRRSVSIKARKKNSSSSSESESEHEKRVTSSPKVMEDYGVALRQGKTSRSSMDDFLKLNIAADTDGEIEKLKKALNPETLEKSLNLSGAYDDAQKRLESASKTWSELQDKISREREISEKQLKALDDEILEDKFLVEQKLANVENDESFFKEEKLTTYEKNESVQKSLESTSRDSVRSQRRIGNLAGVSIENNELSHPQQTCQAEDSQTSERVSPKVDVNEEQTERNKSELINTSSDENNQSIDKKDTSPKSSDKFIENGLSSDRVDEPDVKLINYNKQKLLAAMKAIDDNENIDFSTQQKYRPPHSAVRSQSIAMENLYRGLPAHARKKDDLLKEIFGDGKVESKLRAGCSKLH